MPITLGSNIGSLKAQRRLAENTSTLSNTYERLSSGQRINKASDDAAGLAISSSLNSRSKVYGQAIRNANDGISLYTIADATVSSLTDINTRLQELAEQSANGVYSSSQRKAIDVEAQALAKEYFRISRAAQFNGQRLFDGSMSEGLRLQLGYGISGSIQSSVGGKLGDGSLTAVQTFNNEFWGTYGVTLGDLNGDGALDMVTVGQDDGSTGYSMGSGIMTIRLGSGNGQFGAGKVYKNHGSVGLGITTGDFNADGILDLATIGQETLGTSTLSIRLGRGDGTFGASTSYSLGIQADGAKITVGDLNGDGRPDIAASIYEQSGSGAAAVLLGAGNGNFAAVTTYSMGLVSTKSIALGDLNGDGVADLIAAGEAGAPDTGEIAVRWGNGKGGFSGAALVASSLIASQGGFSDLKVADVNGDGRLDILTTSQGQGYLGVTLATGAGTFSAITTFFTTQTDISSVSLADMNGDGFLDAITAGSESGEANVSVLLGKSNGQFSLSSSASFGWSVDSYNGALATGDVNHDGVIDVIGVGIDVTPEGLTSVLLGNTRDGISPLQPFSLQSRAEALQALGLFSRTAKNLSDIRGTLGATQSRLAVAINGLTSARENFVAADARIRDADIAQESAQLGRTQILQQAGSAVLAQANQAPALALRLLT